MAITVRYRLDPRAAGLHSRQSAAAGRERNCSSNSGQRGRELVPHYTVRDVFSAKRGECSSRRQG